MNLQDRLAAVFPPPQKRGLQAEIVTLCGVSRPTVSAWFNNPEKVSTINRTHAELICATYRPDVSPTWLADGSGSMTSSWPAPSKYPSLNNGLKGQDPEQAVVVTKEMAPFLPGFEGLSIPILAQSGAMGTGVDQLPDDVVVGRLTVSPEWVSRTLKPLSNMKNLRFIHGYGDSMEPTFQDGDLMLVDIGVKDPAIDGIYVLEANDRIYIKRVRQRLNGEYEVTSDNPIVKTVDDLNSAGVSVCGRVVWVWNGKKL